MMKGIDPYSPYDQEEDCTSLQLALHGSKSKEVFILGL